MTRRREMGCGAMGRTLVRKKDEISRRLRTLEEFSVLLVSRKEAGHGAQFVSSDDLRLVLSKLPDVIRQGLLFNGAYSRGFGGRGNFELNIL